MAINPFLAIRGGLNGVAGAFRMSRLDMLSDNVRDQRDALKTARDTSDAALEALTASPSDSTKILAFAKASVAADKATYDELKAQAILDRAQNEQAGYQAITGGLELGEAFFGPGSGGGGGGAGMMGGGAEMALLAAAGAGIGGWAGARSGSSVGTDKP